MDYAIKILREEINDLYMYFNRAERILEQLGNGEYFNNSDDSIIWIIGGEKTAEEQILEYVGSIKKYNAETNNKIEELKRAIKLLEG